MIIGTKEGRTGITISKMDIMFISEFLKPTIIQKLLGKKLMETLQ